MEAGLFFKNIDTDGDGAITKGEANTYLKHSRTSKKCTRLSLEHSLKIVDKNNDGILSPWDFDTSLKF